MAETQSHAPDLVHRITALRALQKDQEDHELFLEAEDTKKQIAALTDFAKQESERTLMMQQEVEKGELEAAHTREFEEFKRNWETKLAAYRNVAGKLETELRLKHLSSLESEMQKFAATLPVHPKPSAQLLAAKRMKEALVKAQNYTEAHLMLGKIAEIEEKDAQAFVRMTQDKVENMRKQIVQKQTLEFEALRHKHDLAFKELLRQRETELDRLSKKFRNTAFDLVSLQSLVKSRSETRTPKLPITTKRIERILSTARSSHTSPAVSPKTRVGNRSRGGSPRRGDGSEALNA